MRPEPPRCQRSSPPGWIFKTSAAPGGRGAWSVLEGFHAIKHAIRFGGEILGAWTADPR